MIFISKISYLKFISISDTLTSLIENNDLLSKDNLLLILIIYLTVNILKFNIND